MDIQKFLVEALKPVPDQRRGQAFMNKLHAARPELYSMMTASENDPFYNDNLLWSAVSFVAEHWDD